MSQLARMNALFTEGAELVLREAEGDVPAVIYWIAKLNPFEADEARRDGMAARSRSMLAIKEIGTDDYAIFEASIQDADSGFLRNQLIQSRESEAFAGGIRELRQDPEWAERVQIIERALEVPPVAPEEIAYMEKLDGEYVEELLRRVNAIRENWRKEYEDSSLEVLKDAYREAYIEQEAVDSYTRESRATEIWLGLRMCTATKDENGRWRHEGCDHTQLALDSRADVKVLSPTAIQKINEVINSLTMSRDDSRFSDAPASSSASLEQPKPQEASTPSTPEVTSPALAPIS